MFLLHYLVHSYTKMMNHRRWSSHLIPRSIFSFFSNHLEPRVSLVSLFLHRWQLPHSTLPVVRWRSCCSADSGFSIRSVIVIVTLLNQNSMLHARSTHAFLIGAICSIRNYFPRKEGVQFRYSIIFKLHACDVQVKSVNVCNLLKK